MHKFLIYILISGLTLSMQAHAYLDPGTGSYLLQLLLGGLAAGYFAIKHYWMAIKMRLFGKEQEPEEDD